MRVYIAGPMSGIIDNNFPMFDKAKEILEGQGWEVVSPADNSRPYVERGEWPAKRDEIIRWDINAVVNADAVGVLPRWDKSEGAKVEVEIARWLRKPIFDIPGIE
jgi:nucleoside 2-deoxyribosyltransferase